jgi:hypothetical protein
MGTEEDIKGIVANLQLFESIISGILLRITALEQQMKEKSSTGSQGGGVPD